MSEQAARREARARPSSPDTVHNRIAMLRVERGITRRELADALGVHYQTIGYLERGEYSPSLALAFRIARFFDLPLEAVFSDRPFPPVGGAPRGDARRHVTADATTELNEGEEPRDGTDIHTA